MSLHYPSPRPHPSGSHAAYIPSPHARTFIALGPLSPTKVPRISLKQFCDHYRILDENKVHLMKLGYIPGNRNIKTLDWADWKDDAGFPTFTWQSILETHDRFLADIKDGVWDNIETYNHFLADVKDGVWDNRDWFLTSRLSSCWFLVAIPLLCVSHSFTSRVSVYRSLHSVITSCILSLLVYYSITCHLLWLFLSSCMHVTSCNIIARYQTAWTMYPAW